MYYVKVLSEIKLTDVRSKRKFMLRSSLLVRKTVFCIEPSAFICVNSRN